MSASATTYRGIYRLNGTYNGKPYSNHLQATETTASTEAELLAMLKMQHPGAEPEIISLEKQPSN
ncbi:hypothetical protein ACTXIU_13110 [Glutamicibacter arilaitensis]|uniref:hypothetical protein n=1 Tax=Glutamicibacter arilaitensis TaxID=256701 RepID=UPI003FD365F3